MQSWSATNCQYKTCNSMIMVFSNIYISHLKYHNDLSNRSLLYTGVWFTIFQHTAYTTSLSHIMLLTTSSPKHATLYIESSLLHIHPAYLPDHPHAKRTRAATHNAGSACSRAHPSAKPARKLTTGVFRGPHCRSAGAAPAVRPQCSPEQTVVRR